MPVPTNGSPKSNLSRNIVPASETEMETVDPSTRESLLSHLPPRKESMILVQVNQGATFTIQAENSIQRIEGPAQVPMVSPNGAIPPIQVPQGYIPQVTEDHGFRKVVVIPENQPVVFHGAALVPPSVHLMSTMPHISMRPGVCYNYVQQGGVPGNQPTSVYTPCDQNNFIAHAMSGLSAYNFARPDGLSASQFQMMPVESEEGQRDKSKDPIPQMAAEVHTQYPALHPRSTPPHRFSSNGPSSSASVSSLSSTSSPNSPQKISDTHGRASSGENLDQISEGSLGTSGMNSDLESMKVQSIGSKKYIEMPKFAKHVDSLFSPVRSCQRSSMPGDEFDLKTYLSAISKPEVVPHTPNSASICWTMRYVRPTDANWTVRYEIYLMSKTKDGGQFKVVKECTTEEMDLTNLKPGVEYHAKIRAAAKTIQGAFSEIAKFKTPSCPPNTPAAPKITNRTKSSFVLKWTAPNDNGEKIFKYLLEWDEGKRSGFSLLYSDSQKQYKVDKLQPSQSYTFRLSCENAMGVSAWSPEVTYQTACAAPPTPCSPVLVESRVQSLILQWGFPQDTRAGRQTFSSEPKFVLQMDDGKGYGFMPVCNGPDRTYTVTGLTKSSPYRFRVRAYNDNGQSGFSLISCHSTLPDKPSPPGKVTLRGKAHSTHFKVHWAEPADDGGSEIEEYVLEYSLGKGQKMLQLYRGSNNEFTVTDAVPGSTYRMRVSCISKGGSSMPSEVGYVPVPSVVPGRCLPPWSSMEPTSSIIHLQWGTPEYDGGSEVTHYELGVCQENGEIKSVYLDTKLNASIPNLKPASTYKFTVRAGNKTGMGRWSEFVELQSGPASPDPPYNLQAAHVTAKNLHLSWMKPHDNGSDILQYIVEYGRQESTLNCREIVLALTCTIQHLTPNNLYFFRVQCENDVGRSSFSDVITVKTAPSCPGSITKIWQVDVPSVDDDLEQDDEDEYLQPDSATSVLIEWEKPFDFGSEITGYRVEISAAKSSKDKSQEENFVLMEVEAVTQLHIEDLSPDQEYKVRVRAINAVGLGQFSPVFSMRTQPLPPDPPALECIPSSTSLRLRWTSANAEDGYKLQMLDKYGRFTTVYEGVSKSYKIVKLEEKAEYMFRINAENEAGEGPFSNLYSFFTTSAPPPQLKNLPSVTVREDRAIISWDSIDTIKGDQVSYIIAIKSSDAPDVQQVITDENDYLLRDLLPGVNYAIQVAILRHARTKRKCLDAEEKTNTVKEISESTTSGTDVSGERQIVSEPVKEVIEDIAGPFTAWVNFKLKVAEATAPLSHHERKDEASSSLSLLIDRIKMLLNDDRVSPVFLMMLFFVLAFISAYLVQFVVD